MRCRPQGLIPLGFFYKRVLMTDKINGNYGEKSDHEIIVELEQKEAALEKRELALEEEVKELRVITEKAIKEKDVSKKELAISQKLSGQISIVRQTFLGVFVLILTMALLTVLSWAFKVSTLEKELAFFERILLVLTGILGGAVSSTFDTRGGNSDG